MRIEISALFAAAAVMMIATPGTAGFMDESNCKRGQFAYDLDSTLSALDKRIVACFNYSEELRVETFNRLIDEINRLRADVDELRSSLDRAEDRIDDLESR